MATKQGIYFGDSAEAFLSEISSKTVNRALDRLAEIIRRERVEKLFSGAEWLALRDMLNGAISEPASMIKGSLAQSWDDSVVDGIAEKWDVDPSAMDAKLRALSYPQEVAVIHGVERWWQEQTEKQGDR